MNDIEELLVITKSLGLRISEELDGLRQTMHEGFAGLNAKFDEQDARLDALEADPEFAAWVERMKEFERGPE